MYMQLFGIVDNGLRQQLKIAGSRADVNRIARNRWKFAKQLNDSF